MLTLKVFTVNPLEENCYVLSDDTHEAVVIDNGAFDAEEKTALYDYLDKNHLTPVRQILTHAHFDHIFGVDDFYKRYGVKVDFHADDSYLYYDAPAQLKAFIGRPMHVKIAPKGVYLADGDLVHFGHCELKVIHTPGHSCGGVCYYCESEKMLFCGDSLFKGSVGRTDLEGGNHRQLIDSMSNKVLTLPEDVIVYPGHGPSTSVSYERRYNPYIAEDSFL